MSENKFFWTAQRSFIFISLGLLVDSIDVYMGGAVVGSVTSSGWASNEEGAAFLSWGFCGMFIGSLIMGVIGDCRGRGTVYRFNLLIFGLFTVFSSLSPDIRFLTVFRFISCIGLGGELVSGFSYIKESSSVEKSGRNCALVPSVANCGVPIATLLSALIVPRWSWRPLFVCMGVLALVIWRLRRNVPESIQWLSVKGNSAGANEDSNMTLVPCPVAKVQRMQLIRHLVVGVFIGVTITVCSYGFVTWIPSILMSRGIDLSQSLFASTFMGMGAPLGCIVTVLLVDCVGRKRLMVSGFLVVAIFGVIYSKQSNYISALIVGFFLTVTLYILTSVIIAVYIPELFSTVVRLRCVGVVNAVSKLCNVFMPLIVSWFIGIGRTEWICYCISVLAMISILIITVFGPETAKRLCNDW